AHMHPAKTYFFIEVIARAQSIDWDRSKTRRRIVRAPDGRESRGLGQLLFEPSTKFKAMTPDIPPIWREIDVDHPTFHFFHSKEDIFMRNEIWEALDARFPDQLVPRKLGES